MRVIWRSVLTSTSTGRDFATVLSYTIGSTRGGRGGVNISVNGRSEVVTFYEDGASHLMAPVVARYIGALAGNVLGKQGSALVGPARLYKAASDPFNGSFLDDPNDGSDPANWALGQDGTMAASYVTALPPAELYDVAAIFWPSPESDGGKTYAEKATFYTAQQLYAAAMRGRVGKSAGLPAAAVDPDPIPLLHARTGQPDDPRVRLRPDPDRRTKRLDHAAADLGQNFTERDRQRRRHLDGRGERLDPPLGAPRAWPPTLDSRANTNDAGSV